MAFRSDDWVDLVNDVSQWLSSRVPNCEICTINDGSYFDDESGKEIFWTKIYYRLRSATTGQD
jgi:hypothetical protein